MSVSAESPREYFAICEVEEIPRGGARAFDLAEPDGEGQKPFRIVIARNARGDHFAYRNACPHQGVWLNVGSGTFFDESGALRCGRHGSRFDLESGTCVSGPCEGAQLQKIGVAVVTGDVCIHGVRLVEDDRAWDDDDTMDITVPPG
ncbi:nitrite reductase/ring-hydroxylating ferredoxin subunit [Rhodoblastus acidophilus]|uniref:Rieske (2Fe-2S) protein n=1 Tax=Rhodoblastus acidophilus TaxID=1074 RepID=UPI001607DB49|nr:Rieske 2Fe-2S domain-containing protein [Rhodoblastus acidophilus]MCW2285267.1 nitrite reductase/ring-hydroxylating ferredoxin subunit [Rhodoblastus acidophilus]MCW2334223.1 nitrite reductase/ring-hydroxylating ferredoxin subunit [Rhodoblastus acidophilus]